MRLSKTVTKNATSLYVIESTYIHGKKSTRVVEKLGTVEKLSETHADPYAWAKEYVDELNRKQKEEREKSKESQTIQIAFNAAAKIPMDTQTVFNAGYLFLQKEFYRLGLDKICDACSKGKRIKYDLTEVLSRMIYSRILEPGSRVKTFDFSQKLIEGCHFELHDMYRSMSLLANKFDFIQAELYKNTKKTDPNRKDRILYYDCTNYDFSIEEEDDLRKYGKAKSHSPNPVVGMGLFMDEEGIPLACTIYPGNRNEQITMSPLEEKIEKDFQHSKFVVCTDAGLAGNPNKLFNSKNDKAFICTQSIKMMSDDMKEWALDPSGWRFLYDDNKNEVSLDMLEDEEHLDADGRSIYYNKVLYKEKKQIEEVYVTDENNKRKREYIDQRIIITYSLKYRDYLRCVRNRQISRAEDLLKDIIKEDGTVQKSKLKKKRNSNDYKRFINSINMTSDGEVADIVTAAIDKDVIENEEMYDGFYGVATNLNDAPESIISINKKRWQIENLFRITKNEFLSSPVYVSREDRIRTHFLVVFLSLVLFRYFEKHISSTSATYSIDDIISQLRDMNMYASSGNGYIPTYKRTYFTDRLHEVYNFRTDYQIITNKSMRKIVQNSKT